MGCFLGIESERVRRQEQVVMGMKVMENHAGKRAGMDKNQGAGDRDLVPRSGLALALAQRMRKARGRCVPQHRPPNPPKHRGCRAKLMSANDPGNFYCSLLF